MATYRKDIPSQVKTKLWVLSGGRCEYKDCNKKLWRDEVTLQELNGAYIAHIISPSESGPRYDKDRSEILADDFSNLMLLCDFHHRMIDNKNDTGEPPEIHHPEGLLLRYKKEHEERIDFMTSINSSRSSYPMIVKGNIEDFKIIVDIEEARDAMLPDRRPASAQFIEIDLTKSSIKESDEDFWNINKKEIERQLNTKLEMGPDGKEINHLSIFALGPIPLLIFFGKSLGDTIDTNLYQKHRNPGGWQWQDSVEDDHNYIQEYPDKVESRFDEAILEMSISGQILEQQTPKEIDHLPRFKFQVNTPSTSFLNSYEKFELFKKEIRDFLKNMREMYSNIKTLHLLAAVPCPIAIELGRAHMSKLDPKIIIYNASSTEKGTFKRALEVI